MHGLLPLLLVHLDITFLHVGFHVVFIQRDCRITVRQRLFMSTEIVVRARPVEVDSLIVGAVQGVDIEALGEEARRDLVHLVLEGLACASLQVFSLVQALPESLDFLVIWVDLQCLANLLFGDVGASIVEKYATTPEKKDGAGQKAILVLLGDLHYLAQVIRAVQNACLDSHFDVTHRVLAVLENLRRVEHCLSIVFGFHGPLNVGLILDEFFDERHFIGHRRVPKLNPLLNALFCLFELALSKVTCVGSQVSFRKLRVHIQSLLAVEESLLVFSLLDVRHRSISEYSFILLKFKSFGIEANSIVDFTGF